jgi:hypothetical protein
MRIKNNSTVLLFQPSTFHMSTSVVKEVCLKVLFLVMLIVLKLSYNFLANDLVILSL